MKIALLMLLISAVGIICFVLGAIMTEGKRADEEEVRALRGQRSEPDLVLIAPTEFRKVKKV